jgi:inner membrane protein
MISPNQVLVVIGLVMILAELIVGIQAGFDLVLIGSIAILGGIVGIYTSNFSIALVVSTILSAIYILFGRQFVQKKLIILTKKTNIDKLVGKKGLVVRSITPDTAGLIRIDDEDWRASSDQVLYEKDKVEVVSLEGVTLNVRKSS